ncbi:erythromycin esterase family protein [Deefgea rivuli]|uniref:erythromycin esterase family protein n=1 Tax=Deefgea rivuli TaxID=400948 RepID=UPI000486549E|nr:erythromycin esterase family protein [Deefgea rivuli]
MRSLIIVGLLGLGLVACGEKNANPDAADKNASVSADATANLQQWLSKSAQPLTALDVAQASDTHDLDAFGAALGNARVVVLNEETYADKNAYELMNRLVQYLHQYKDFDVLLIESAMFDVEGVWRSAVDKNASVVELAPGRVFYMYSQTDASRKALAYLDEARKTERPLTLAGFDIPLAGSTSIKELLPALTQYLQNKGSKIPAQANWAEFRQVAQRAIELNSQGMDLTQFNQVSTQLKAELCQDTTPASVATLRESAGWWCQQVKSIAAGVGRQQHTDDVNYDQRNPVLADNVQWLLDNAFAGKKVIVWTNASHGLPQVSGVDPETKQPIYSMGWHLQQRLGEKIYNVKIAALGGQTNKYWDTGVQDVVVAPNTLESLLKKLDLKQGFVHAPTDPVLLSQFAQLKQPAVFGKDYQGVFFYPQAEPALQGAHAMVPLP